jgi:hypothetical protein
LSATDDQTPSFSSAALPYLPAGTASGSAMERRVLQQGGPAGDRVARRGEAATDTKRRGAARLASDREAAANHGEVAEQIASM